MVSLAQTKKLMSPFLKRHQDFAGIDRRFYRVPITHVAPCVLIDRSGDKDAYRVYLQIYPLVCLRRKGLFAPFFTMYRWQNRSYWRFDDPEWANALDILLDTTVLEDMQAHSSLKNLWNSYETNKDPTSMIAEGMDSPDVRSAILAALGDFAEAERICTSSYNASKQNNNVNLIPIFVHLWPALQSGDKKRIARVLRDWEEETARGLGIQDYWQPTPFDWE